eukprot:3031148-Rhodomonas_salina.2
MHLVAQVIAELHHGCDVHWAEIRTERNVSFLQVGGKEKQLWPPSNLFAGLIYAVMSCEGQPVFDERIVPGSSRSYVSRRYHMGNARVDRWDVAFQLPNSYRAQEGFSDCKTQKCFWARFRQLRCSPWQQLGPSKAHSRFCPSFISDACDESRLNGADAADEELLMVFENERDRSYERLEWPDAGRAVPGIVGKHVAGYPGRPNTVEGPMSHGTNYAITLRLACGPTYFVPLRLYDPHLNFQKLRPIRYSPHFGFKFPLPGYPPTPPVRYPGPTNSRVQRPCTLIRRTTRSDGHAGGPGIPEYPGYPGTRRVNEYPLSGGTRNTQAVFQSSMHPVTSTTFVPGYPPAPGHPG